MNETEYKLLTQACDLILSKGKTRLARVAIPILHVLREHPVFLLQYGGMFQNENAATNHINEKSGKFEFKFSSFKRFVVIFTNFKKASLQEFHKLKKHYLSLKAARKVRAKLLFKADVVFISHLLDSADINNERDLYFGDLPKYLSQYKRVLVLYMNHTTKGYQELNFAHQTPSLQRLVLPDILVHRSLLVSLALFTETFRLIFAFFFEKELLKKKLYLRAARQVWDGTARVALTIGENIAFYTSRASAKTVITTYEGHSWERIAYATSRRELHNVHCIGYHHSALFRLQHALRCSLADCFNPDIIMTTGLVTRHILNQAPGLTKTPIEVLGSQRGLTQSELKQFQKYKPKPKGKRDFFQCLVLPEGIESECIYLVEQAIESALQLPNINFVIRFHPVLSFEILKRSFSINQLNLPNIELSSYSLDVDIERCNWALYRGTTAIFRAILFGLRPIYMAHQKEMSIDPLYELKQWKRIAWKKQDIYNIIENDITFLKDEPNKLYKYQREFQYAWDYCAEYFVPFRPDDLLSYC